MPFSMMHLCIGAPLCASLPIADAGRFWLGCVAPDAVHFHANYTSERKRISHLVPDGIAWGDCREEANPLWLQNLGAFLHEPLADRDFQLGYAAHIALDIYNNLTLWTPLLQRAEAEHCPTLPEQYRAESRAVEQLLRPRLEPVLDALRQTAAVGIPGRIDAADVESLRLQLIAAPAPAVLPDLSGHAILTQAVVDRFLTEAGGFILTQLRAHAV